MLNAQAFLLDAYPGISTALIEAIKDMYVSGIMQDRGDCMEFALRGYPVGLVVKEGNCSCMEDIVIGTIDTCVHRIATELYQYLHQHKEEKGIWMSIPAKTITYKEAASHIA